MKLKKYRSINKSTFILPIVVTIVIIVFTSNAMNKRIRNHYYNQIKDESLNIAKNYSNSLTKVSEAQEIINKLLDSKLLVAGKSITLYEGELSNDLLKRTAKNLEVDVVYYYDKNGVVIFTNDEKYLGWKATEGHPVYNFMKSDDIGFAGDIRKDTESDLYYKYGYFKGKDGSFVQVGVHANKIKMLVDSFDIQNLLDELKGNSNASEICFVDNNFIIVGSTNTEIIGTEIKDSTIKSIILSNRKYSETDTIKNEKVYSLYVPVYSKENKIGTLHLAQPLKDTEILIKKMYLLGILSILIIVVSLIYVIASIAIKNKKLFELAFYDTLTGLPNKEYLFEYLAKEIKDNEFKKGMLLINCSNFRIANLIGGYKYGDKLLKEISCRLKNITNKEFELFRFTADRFVIYVDDYHDKEDLIELSTKICNAFNEPLLDNKYIEVKIGIIEINDAYDKIDHILRDVSIALGYIKSDGKEYAFFDEDMKMDLEREQYIERELRSIIDGKGNSRLFLEYQPQIDLSTNKIIGFEALARLYTESLGNIPPLEFIDIAERKQLIVPLGDLIIKDACDFIKNLNSRYFGNLKVAVNISGIQLLKDDFISRLVTILKNKNINGRNFEIEITESILMDNHKIINEKLKYLREHNITIALDDFGTGYSSFANLRDLNIDYVKIDKYFINRIISSEKEDIITGGIILLCHNIGLKVIAEGVEFDEQRDYLMKHNCDMVQGYLFSKPLSTDDAIKKLKDNYGAENYEI